MAGHTTRLRLAVQKSGRLHDESTALVRECGISLSTGRGSTTLRSEATNFPIDILFLRDDDIPGYVADGVADLGIVGQNVVAESGAVVAELERLGFSRCRLSLAVPRDSARADVYALAGCRVATSYPGILGKHLESVGVKAHVHVISGSVEIAPGIGLADAICDIVGSGSTLAANGLREIDQIFSSEAVLVGHPALADGSRPAASGVLEKLRFRIRSVLAARTSKYVVLNVPDRALEEVVELLPGMRSPTVLPLARKGWSSVHAVVDENEFWEKIETLRATGAEGILVVPIEKMIR